MNFWNYIKTQNRPIVLYGKGNGAEKLLDKLGEMNIEISAVFSSEGFSKSKPFRGYEVTSLDKIKARYDDFIILLAFGSDREDVQNLIKSVNAQHEMYAPHLPLYDSDYTDEEYFIIHKNDIENLKDILEDEQSIKVCEGICKFRNSALLTDIWKCESPVSEGYEILNLGNDEIYLDIGAYRGDTVYEFLQNVSGYCKIWAVEPNIKTYEKLKINTADISNIECINAFISDKEGLITVSRNDGRGSSASHKGSEVTKQSIDKLFANQKITYIKIDAEGEEANIIKGAEDTIRNFKPKMRIAAYHKANDIFDIANQVLKIRDDYKVYLRHYPSVLDWNIDLYFV